MNSRSARNKIVVLNDLPNSSVPSIGIIKSNYVFPILGKLAIDNGYYLHTDGSIFQLYQTEKFNIADLEKIIKGLPTNSSVQVYRLHTADGIEKIYVCIRIMLDYSFVNLKGKKFFDHFFGSYKIYPNKIDQITYESFKLALDLIPQNYTYVNLEDSDLVNYLCDCETENGFIYTKCPLKSNISAILSGINKHSCVFSINNLDAVPMYHSVINSTDYLEIVTIVKPSENQREAIDKVMNVNKEILTAIRPSKTDREVEVDTMQADVQSILDEIRSGIYFINVSFMLRSEISLSDLKEKFITFESELYKKGIVLYCHSNSARTQYISLFPGNSVYGEHWNKIYHQFCLMLTSKVLAL